MLEKGCQISDSLVAKLAMTTNPFTCLMELKDWSIDLQQQA
jgi:hypothetical protein